MASFYRETDQGSSPDLLGCPICHHSIRGGLAECPYCHAPLEPRVTLRVRFGEVIIEVEELVDE